MRRTCGSAGAVWPVIAAGVFLAMLCGSLQAGSRDGPSKQTGAVRPAWCAGTWYPADPDVLRAQVNEYLQSATVPALPGRPVALICPHAGLKYSGRIAATAYKTVRGGDYSRVIILAISHRYGGLFRGASILRDVMYYRTPLGLVLVDRQVCDALLEHPLVSSFSAAHAGEHSLEIQLPFLQCVLKKFRLVPILLGRMELSDYPALARVLSQYVDDRTLLVASSDFTHYGRSYGYVPFKENVPEGLRRLLDGALQPLRLCDFDGFYEHLVKTRDTICGRVPVLLLLKILSMRGGAEGHVLATDFSGRMTGDWSASVTYVAMAFTGRPSRIDDAQRRALLRLARRAARHWLTAGAKLQVPDPAALGLSGPSLEKGAAFVTFTNSGRLRGCIGNIVADRPLYQAVIDNAVNALQDPRFVADPITLKELPDLEIEISVLTPMQRVTDLSEVVVGRDGLMVQYDGYRGLLLPQVAARYGWTRLEFLRQTCVKAGLPASAADRFALKIWKFQAEVFSEQDVFGKARRRDAAREGTKGK